MATATALAATSLLPAFVSAAADTDKATGLSKLIGSVLPETRKKKVYLIDRDVKRMNKEIQNLALLIRDLGCSPEHLATVRNLANGAMQ